MKALSLSQVSRTVKSSMRYFFLVYLLLSIVNVSAALDENVQSIVSPVTQVVCMIYNVIVRVAGAIAGLVFVIAGVKWVASQDDPGERKQAKETMKNAIIGLIIIMVADSIVKSINPTMFGSTCKAGS